MTKRIPNFWKLKVDEPDRLYSLFLCKLMLKEQNERILQVCRIIRRYAARGPGGKEALCTFMYEREALFMLGKLDVALKQARLRDCVRYGRPLDYAHHQWDEKDPFEGYWLIYTLAPLHYYNGLYELGCQLYETGLGYWFNQCKQVSYEWLWNIVPRRKTPGFLQTVTLAMFYCKLGKDLRDWKVFAECFPPRLYRVVGISKTALRDDPRLLRALMTRIRQIQQANRPYCTSGVSRGIHDIIATPEQIRRAHERISRKALKEKPERRERSDHFDKKLMEYFPELR